MPMIDSSIYPRDNNNGNNYKRSETMTFRIDNNVMQELQSEAKQRKVSLNTFVNQILMRFVEWDMYESKVGIMPIPKPILAALFEDMTKEEIIDLATNIGKNAVRDIALFMKGKIDLDSFLSWFESRMKNSFIITRTEEERRVHKYMIKHDLGENWSLYQKTVLELIFNEVLKKPVSTYSTKTTLIVIFEY
jgi:hypothetical protein